MSLDYQKLWKKGGYGEDNPLENTLSFIFNKAEELKLPKGSAEVAINEVFTGLDKGMEFSLNKCHCGCGIDKSGTDITHAMLDNLIIVGAEIKKRQGLILEKRLQASLKIKRPWYKSKKKWRP